MISSIKLLKRRKLRVLPPIQEIPTLLLLLSLVKPFHSINYYPLNRDTLHFSLCDLNQSIAELVRAAVIRGVSLVEHDGSIVDVKSLDLESRYFDPEVLIHVSSTFDREGEMFEIVHNR